MGRKKTYYVVEMYIDNLLNSDHTGEFIWTLVDSFEVGGEGNFCGWFNLEFLINVNTLAYRRADTVGYIDYEKHYDRLDISNPFTATRIFAKSKAEAKRKFGALYLYFHPPIVPRKPPAHEVDGLTDKLSDSIGSVAYGVEGIIAETDGDIITKIEITGMGIIKKPNATDIG